ncbi:U-box domain-containing protein 34-like [Aristolochia californica]|uniref:U-box domain-containing protein 34-like n=1 Tax=Aristolochia californica TaxID=171875 RepID=UPI0035DF481C
MAVVVAVNGSHRSRRAFRWALEKFPPSDPIVLVHVAPPVVSVPTPSGKQIPVKQMRTDVAAKYLQDMKLKAEEVFIPLKKLCQTREVETLLLEDDSPAAALLRYASESSVKNLVLGSASSSNCFMRKFKGGLDLPSSILELAPNTCSIYVVLRKKTLTRVSNISNLGPNTTQLDHSIPHNQTSEPNMLTQRGNKQVVDKEISGSGLSQRDSKGTYSQSVGHEDSAISNAGIPEATALSPSNAGISEVTVLSPIIGRKHLKNETLQTQTFKALDYKNVLEYTSPVLHSTNLLEAQVEVEKLKIELSNTFALYNEACQELAYVKNKAHLLSAECSEEASKVRDALEREATFKKSAEAEKTKHLEIIKEVEEARTLFAREAYERQKAEMNALKVSFERKKIVDSLLLSDKRYKRYTNDEIVAATEGFSESKKIGEGGYGKVYKCSIDYTPVAVKVLQLDATDKKEEFLKEVEVLSQLRHPHLVLLLGACPESGCLVYEYMDNGSLEDRLFCRNNTPPIPWCTRFQIILEVARGLAFLHGFQPEPIVHRDLKPGNILLDTNYVSKIGDVGLAKILSDIVPDNITAYHETVLAGTLYYMDPEYQRTGTIRPKSDLYALGVIILQMLTGKHPAGLLTTVENAIKNGSFRDVLDKSITDWPQVSPEKLAWIGLSCSRLRCRDRPDIESEVIPQLEELVDLMDDRVRVQQINVYAPSHYLCPILQEVMGDPYIAADGFTYEQLAIKKWLEKYHVSPVTKQKLPHIRITPNHSMRSAIQEWKLESAFSRY